MKRIVMSTIQLVVLAGLAAAVAPAARADSCTPASLRGNYGALLTGTIPYVGPFVALATVNFNGAGSWSYSESGNLNGSPFPRTDYTGTYTVAPDCRGTTKDSGNNSTDLVIVNGGKEVWLIGTTPGAVFSIVLKKLGADD
jgi:hypothetical protein